MKTLASTIIDAAIDPAIDARIRPFLAELNKNSDPFWELPGDRVRAILTGIQNQTPVDLSGITVQEKTIAPGGKPVLLYIVRPEGVNEKLPVLLFIHGGV